MRYRRGIKRNKRCNKKQGGYFWRAGGGGRGRNVGQERLPHERAKWKERGRDEGASNGNIEKKGETNKTREKETIIARHVSRERRDENGTASQMGEIRDENHEAPETSIDGEIREKTERKK